MDQERFLEAMAIIAANHDLGFTEIEISPSRRIRLRTCNSDIIAVLAKRGFSLAADDGEIVVEGAADR